MPSHQWWSALDIWEELTLTCSQKNQLFTITLQGEKGWKCLSSFSNNSCSEAGGLSSPVVSFLLMSLIHSYLIFHDASPCEIALWLPRTHILSWQSQVFPLSSQPMTFLLVTQTVSQVLIQILLIPITPKFLIQLQLGALSVTLVWAWLNWNVISWKIHTFLSIILDLNV